MFVGGNLPGTMSGICLHTLAILSGGILGCFRVIFGVCCHVAINVLI